MEERMITITMEEYKMLLMARTRLNTIAAWMESGDYMSLDDVKHVLGIWKEEVKE